MQRLWAEDDPRLRQELGINSFRRGWSMFCVIWLALCEKSLIIHGRTVVD